MKNKGKKVKTEKATVRRRAMRKMSKAHRRAAEGIKVNATLVVVRVKHAGDCRSSPIDRIDLAKPCSECTRWLHVAESLGVSISVWHSDSSGEVIPFDDHPHHYKPKVRVW